ncbi:hypothetical protein GJ496_002536 [Pomphorhynchus laevis]|nr:hypothetical protein GJ496_002536 [Pomphorhynchus laevis]
MQETIQKSHQIYVRIILSVWLKGGRLSAARRLLTHNASETGILNLSGDPSNCSILGELQRLHPLSATAGNDFVLNHTLDGYHEHLSVIFSEMIASLFDELLPEILGKPDINSDYKNVFRLPSRLGELWISDPTIDPSFEYKGSLEICTHLINHTNITDIVSKQTEIAANIRKERHTRNSAIWEIAKSTNDPLMKTLIINANLNGASSWLIVLCFVMATLAAHIYPFFQVWLSRRLSKVLSKFRRSKFHNSRYVSYTNSDSQNSEPAKSFQVHIANVKTAVNQYHLGTVYRPSYRSVKIVLVDNYQKIESRRNITTQIVTTNPELSMPKENIRSRVHATHYALSKSMEITNSTSVAIPLTVSPEHFQQMTLQKLSHDPNSVKDSIFIMHKYTTIK